MIAAARGKLYLYSRIKVSDPPGDVRALYFKPSDTEADRLPDLVGSFAASSSASREKLAVFQPLFLIRNNLRCANCGGGEDGRILS